MTSSVELCSATRFSVLAAHPKWMTCPVAEKMIRKTVPFDPFWPMKVGMPLKWGVPEVLAADIQIDAVDSCRNVRRSFCRIGRLPSIFWADNFDQ